MDYRPVSHTSETRRLSRLPSDSDVAVTVHRYEGGDGPTLYLQAAQHGIELNGPAALRRLHHTLLGTEIAGTVVVVPVVNPIAFDHRSYMTPSALDVLNPNLNRLWPGDPDGSLQERFVDRLWRLLEGADAAIDLHTGTADMLQHVRYRAGNETSKSLASVFGAEYLLRDDGTDDTFFLITDEGSWQAHPPIPLEVIFLRVPGLLQGPIRKPSSPTHTLPRPSPPIPRQTPIPVPWERPRAPRALRRRGAPGPGDRGSGAGTRGGPAGRG